MADCVFSTHPKHHHCYLLSLHRYGGGLKWQIVSSPHIQFMAPSQSTVEDIVHRHGLFASIDERAWWIFPPHHWRELIIALILKSTGAKRGREGVRLYVQYRKSILQWCTEIAPYRMLMTKNPESSRVKCLLGNEQQQLHNVDC